ncbi:VOC family protein [Streptomyces angustmyceticus]|uniref:VOC family protein n=1 Tax=Streptomyces angustmyceticus TaxID=285578 RepID=UPI003D8AE1E1
MPRAPSSSDGITATDPRRPRRGPAAIPISCDLHGGSNSDFAGLTRPDGLVIGSQRVADHRPPRWPEETAAQQAHLDFAVDDLDEAEGLLGPGAVKPEHQTGGDRWRVPLDPAGHPFCLTRG